MMDGQRYKHPHVTLPRIFVDFIGFLTELPGLLLFQSPIHSSVSLLVKIYDNFNEFLLLVLLDHFWVWSMYFPAPVRIRTRTIHRRTHRLVNNARKLRPHLGLGVDVTWVYS